MDRGHTVISAFHPAVRTWFEKRFSTVTEPQELAFPLIKKDENVLLSSPTGSGKTLAAFLVSIDYLVHQAENNQLENMVYVIYVSPLRALSNDIKKNLTIPLEGIRKEAPFAKIRAFVRTGDTSAYRRSKMLKETPHILITTPETLQIVLNAPKFSQKLTNVKYVIVDEIHDLCNTKRGVSLSLSLERLQNLAGPFVRIGLSATQAPIEEIAQFLVGNGRSVRVLIAEKEKTYDIAIAKPESLSVLSLEKAVEETYDILKELIESHNVTLVFSNTRSRTERIVYQLKNRGLYSVAAHHGSMGKETRHKIEDLLKKGQIKSVITSTSLELGIDIGDVDLVVQLGSPKNTAKLMQRIGRAGHGHGDVSKGVLVAQDRDELVDLEIMRQKALDYELEPIQIPKNCFDVLSQHLIGMSLERVWGAEEAFQIIRKSYCYKTLQYTEFVNVLEYLGGYYADLEKKHVYRKLWFDGKNFGRVKAALYLYFLNCGTIPSEATFFVVLNGIPLGTLSEHFVSNLKPRDIFVLGGRSLEYIKIEGMNVLVRDALGGKPTVPSWRGEALSRSYEFSADLSSFRTRMNSDLSQILDPDILSYFEEQKKAAGILPTADTLYIERYIDGESTYHLIFHAPFGRRVNEALARGYGQQLNCPDFTVTDNGFMLNSANAIAVKKDILKSCEFKNVLKASVWDTELFYQRFRHCAERGFLLLKNYKGTSISPRTQYFRARSLLKELPFDFPIVKETFNEVLYTALDCEHAIEVLQKIESGEITIIVSDYTTIPSPFALSIVMAGAQDIITLKDRSEFLQHMQKAVVERIIEASPAFDLAAVEEYYSGRERFHAASVKENVQNVLYCGIKTAREIASAVQMEKKSVERVLDDLIAENLVSCGYFTAPELQYMLVKDRRILEYGEGFEDHVVKQFLVKKHFDFKTIQEVFAAYGYLRSKRAVYDRIGFFSSPLLKIKIRGRLGYILPEDAPLFVSAYREELPVDQRKILNFIQKHPGLKRKEILAVCESDFSKLEETLHVYRDETNRFYSLEAAPYNKEKAKKEIIHRFIASCGPVSEEEIFFHTGFKDIQDILCDYEKVTIFSRIVQEMYCTEKDYKALKESIRTAESPEKEHIKSIDHSDPLYEKVRYDSSPPLEESFSPLLIEGTVAGGILYRMENSNFCIAECTLFENSISAEDLFREIQRIYKFYRWHGARNISMKPELLRKMGKELGYHFEDETLIDVPIFTVEPEAVYFTQVNRQMLLQNQPAEKVLVLPFLDADALQNRTAEDIKEVLENQKAVEVTYENRKYICLPEDRTMYEKNDVQELVRRLLDSFLILSPFQIAEVVKAELFEIENHLEKISQKVYYQGEVHYVKDSEFASTDECNITFLPITDPYIAINNKKWLLKGTAILINGNPAGYYTLEENQADLNLYKRFKEYWGNILVSFPSENIAIRTINGRPVKNTRFARTSA
jgi:Lhr-like helicase